MLRVALFSSAYITDDFSRSMRRTRYVNAIQLQKRRGAEAKNTDQYFIYLFYGSTDDDIFDVGNRKLFSGILCMPTNKYVLPLRVT